MKFHSFELFVSKGEIRLSQRNWFVSGSSYANRFVRRSKSGSFLSVNIVFESNVYV